ncbi:MAG: polyprenyl diphosphate synthase [Pseudomonadota bacterium]
MTDSHDRLERLDEATAALIDARAQALPSEPSQERPADRPLRVPRHVAMIMDGNGRWAERRGLRRTEGHLEGMERLREVVKAAHEWGVETLTLFAFSTENWSRPGYEVAVLMQVFRRYLDRAADEAKTSGIRVRFVGQIDRLPGDIVRRARDVEARTARNDQMTIQIAVSYGARAEIADAARRLAAAAARGEIAPEAIDEEMVGRALWTNGAPDPDVVIRTSGEQRVSNFLLWQAAYAEYVFVDECWPDFSRAVFARVLAEYARRERRFGGLTAVPDAAVSDAAVPPARVRRA